MMETVETPGDTQSKAAIEPSALTTSVLKLRMPPLPLIFLYACTLLGNLSISPILHFAASTHIPAVDRASGVALPGRSNIL